MPTKHRRHAVTETGPVAEALERLRAAVGPDGFTISELVVLGAERMRLDHEVNGARRERALRELAEEIRNAALPPMDVEAADEVRRTGWVRPL